MRATGLLRRCGLGDDVVQFFAGQQRYRAVHLALIAAIATGAACAEARRPGRIGAIIDLSDAGSLPDAAAAVDSGASVAAGRAGSTPGAGAGAGSAGGTASGSDARCGRVPEQVACAGSTPIGYTTYETGSPDGPFHCVPIGGPGCLSEPPPFATLSDCLAACEPDVTGDETSCQEPSNSVPACTPDAGAELARLEARTPFGALTLNRAWLRRTHGFTLSVNVAFTEGDDPAAFPAVSITLRDPFDMPSLAGSHDMIAVLALCGRTAEIPVRVAITRDELVPGISERFEGTIESLAPDIELRAEFRFRRVCAYNTDV